MDLRIPYPRKPPTFAEWLAALKAEHAFCSRRSGAPNSLAYTQAHAGCATFRLECTCGGTWTKTLTHRDGGAST